MIYIRNNASKQVIQTIDGDRLMMAGAHNLPHVVLWMLRRAIPVAQRLDGKTDGVRRLLVCGDLVDALDGHPEISEYSLVCNEANNPPATCNTQTVLDVHVTFNTGAGEYSFSLSTRALAGF